MAPSVKVYTVPTKNDVGCERCGCRPQAPGETKMCPVCNYETSIDAAIKAIENQSFEAREEVPYNVYPWQGQ